jgi:hypothetical protein
MSFLKQAEIASRGINVIVSFRNYDKTDTGDRS